MLFISFGLTEYTSIAVILIIDTIVPLGNEGTGTCPEAYIFFHIRNKFSFSHAERLYSW